MRISKNISLDPDIIKDIKERGRKYSFNFSEWVGKKYREEFLNINLKQKEIEDLSGRIEQLKQDIRLSKKYEKIARKIINTTERRFLLNVPIMLKSGSNLEGLCEVFNRLNGKDLKFNEFEKLVEAVKNVEPNKK